MKPHLTVSFFKISFERTWQGFTSVTGKSETMAAKVDKVGVPRIHHLKIQALGYKYGVLRRMDFFIACS
jgi:hypothetical protein